MKFRWTVELLNRLSHDMFVIPMPQDAFYLLKWYLRLCSHLDRVGARKWGRIVPKFMEKNHGMAFNIT